MPFNSKKKGSNFERHVASEILKAAGKGFTKEDCYRTPMSGGHIYASKEQPSDLVISTKLRKLFPFVVECKHHKNIDLQHLFTGQGLFKKWIEQCDKATGHIIITQAIYSLDKMFYTMVVFKWNSSKVFCIVPDRAYKQFFRKNKPYLRFYFLHCGWRVVLFSDLLKQVFCK